MFVAFTVQVVIMILSLFILAYAFVKTPNGTTATYGETSGSTYVTGLAIIIALFLAWTVFSPFFAVSLFAKVMFGLTVFGVLCGLYDRTFKRKQTYDVCTKIFTAMLRTVCFIVAYFVFLFTVML